MRVLLLLRGAPGAGKSTFIEQNGLKPFALSADDIRLLCSAPQMNSDGSYGINQKSDKDVWGILFKLLELRMKRGEFTVIDATNSKTVEMNRYKEMCDTYRYRMYCVDLTDVPLEECKRRNHLRPDYKQVPDDALEKIYARFATQKIPSGIKVIKPNELDTVWLKQFDLSSYDKIVHIGDIHGCHTALMEYFKNGLQDNYMYIFCGDLVDRGLENAEVVKFFLEIYKKPNVLILEGNHERWLWTYGNGVQAASKEFEFVTKKQLQSANIDPKDVRSLYRKFGQCAWYKYDDKNVLVTHAGLSKLPKDLNFTKLATHQMINGVGDYNDFEKVADTWMQSTEPDTYQIHGHRNTKNSPTQIRERVFNLEGDVEHGGYLRIVELGHDGFHIIEIKNDVFKTPEEVAETREVVNSSIADVVLNLRNNRYIMEKQFGNISSFNFTDKAFYENNWNKQTILARGLYINTNTMKVVARAFSKFFNVNEMPFTKFDMLQHKLQFPVTCYVKENGFLGLVSYNEETDDFFITSKSTPEGSYSMWLKNMFYEKVPAEHLPKIKEFCKHCNVTFVFECVDQVHDPHIVEYPNNELYLLAIVKNEIDFKQYEYDDLVKIGHEFGMKVKEKAVELADWTEFYDWYNEVTQEDYEYNGRIIEGFVIEDSSGFMTKLKLAYYKSWKYMRTVANITLKKGYIDKTSSLTTAESNLFYGFMKELHDKLTKEEIETLPKDIIYLRKLFYEDRKKKKEES